MIPGLVEISCSHSGSGREVNVCFSKPLNLFVNLAKEDGFRLQSVSSAPAARTGLFTVQHSYENTIQKCTHNCPHFNRDIVIPLAATASSPPTRHISKGHPVFALVPQCTAAVVTTASRS